MARAEFLPLHIRAVQAAEIAQASLRRVHLKEEVVARIL